MHSFWGCNPQIPYFKDPSLALLENPRSSLGVCVIKFTAPKCIICISNHITLVKWMFMWLQYVRYAF